VVAGPFPAKYWMFIHPEAVVLMFNDYIMPLLYLLQNTFQSKPRTKVLEAKKSQTNILILLYACDKLLLISTVLSL
jgi:hypothetical protein